MSEELRIRTEDGEEQSRVANVSKALEMAHAEDNPNKHVGLVHRKAAEILIKSTLGGPSEHAEKARIEEGKVGVDVTAADKFAAQNYLGQPNQVPRSVDERIEYHTGVAEQNLNSAAAAGEEAGRRYDENQAKLESIGKT